MCQYRYENKVTTVYGGINHLLQGDEKSFPDDSPVLNDAQWIVGIHDILAANGETYYLICSSRKFDTHDIAYYVDFCKITENGVVMVNGFLCSDTIKESLSMEADLFAIELEDEICCPEYEEKARVLRMPVTDDKARIVGEERWMFDGKLFVRE